MRIILLSFLLSFNYSSLVTSCPSSGDGDCVPSNDSYNQGANQSSNQTFTETPNTNKSSNYNIDESDGGLPDDYVAKPYSVVELMARIHAQLRRSNASMVGEKLSFSDIELDSESHKVFRGGSEIKLGPTEYRLLSFLMEKPGRVRTRDQLLDRVWGRDIYVDSRTVDVHVGRLRKALTQYGGSDPIRTVRGAGYSLG